MGNTPKDPQERRKRKKPRKSFSNGSLIEVVANEETSKDVYYLATVISQPPRLKGKGSRSKRYNRLCVKYHDLLKDENGSDRLKEYVNVANVRPAPPPQEIVERLQVNDVVDAFYLDGWWMGVVTSVVDEGSKYKVIFQNPPDVLELGFSILRVHWDWVDGIWVRPARPCEAALMFYVGRKVEVSFDVENCHGAWFPATIVEILIDGSFLVEYSSKTTGNEAQTLKITVDSLHVRPSPPCLKDKKIVLLEKVDAFYDFGWWSGVIAKELEGGRYAIFFEKTQKEMEFNQSEIRPHMEWKDCKWFASSQVEGHISVNATRVAVPVGSSGKAKDNTEEEITCSLNAMESEMGQSTPCNQKPSRVTTSLTKRSPSDSLDELPLKKLKERNLVSAQSLEPHQQNTLNTPSEAMLCCGASPTSERTKTSSDKQPLPRDRSSNNSYLGKRIRKQRFELGNRTSSSMQRRGSTKAPQAKSPESFAGVLARTGKRSLRGKGDQQSDSKEPLKPVNNQEQQSNDSGIQTIKEKKQSENESIQKGKSQRPPKKLIKSHQTQVADTMVVNDHIANEVGSHTTAEVEKTRIEDYLYNQESTMHNLINGLPKQKNRSGSRMRKILTKVPDERVVEGSINPCEKHSSKRGRRRAADKKISSQVEDSLDASGGKTMVSNSIRNEVENGVAEVTGSQFDNEPLSRWIEEIQSPTAADGSGVLKTLEQCVETANKQKEIVVVTDGSERQKESGMQDSTFVEKSLILQIEQQSLPFVKNTVLWNAIESMEVFKRMPQKPHFQLLEYDKENSREGLAIGLMVTFSSLVEKVSCLQHSDPKSIAQDILETLADLERYGFDVQTVRDRATQLLLVKDGQEKLLGQVDDISSQIVEHNLERNVIDEEISEIKKQISSLQEKLSLAESAKTKKEHEIASLKSKLPEIEESIRSAVCDFEGLAATPL